MSAPVTPDRVVENGMDAVREQNEYDQAVIERLEEIETRATRITAQLNETFELQHQCTLVLKELTARSEEIRQQQRQVEETQRASEASIEAQRAALKDTLASYHTIGYPLLKEVSNSTRQRIMHQFPNVMIPIGPVNSSTVATTTAPTTPPTTEQAPLLLRLATTATSGTSVLSTGTQRTLPNPPETGSRFAVAADAEEDEDGDRTERDSSDGSQSSSSSESDEESYDSEDERERQRRRKRARMAAARTSAGGRARSNIARIGDNVVVIRQANRDTRGLTPAQKKEMASNDLRERANMLVRWTGVLARHRELTNTRPDGTTYVGLATVEALDKLFDEIIESEPKKWFIDLRRAWYENRTREVVVTPPLPNRISIGRSGIQRSCTLCGIVQVRTHGEKLAFCTATCKIHPMCDACRCYAIIRFGGSKCPCTFFDHTCSGK